MAHEDQVEDEESEDPEDRQDGDLCDPLPAPSLVLIHVGQTFQAAHRLEVRSISIVARRPRG